eukprot:250370_1
MAAQLEETNELETWLLSNNINDSVLLEALNNEEIETVDDLLLFENNDIKQVLLTKVKMGKIAKLLRALNQHRANNTQQPSEQKNQTNDEIKSNEELKANDTINLVTNDKDFIYESDFDTNGILYALGTGFGSKEYTLPLDIVKVETCFIMSNGGHEAAFIGQQDKSTIATKTNVPSPWYSVDFVVFKIKPTRYSLRYCCDFGRQRPLNWEFQGSNDNKNWICLKRHNRVRLSPQNVAATNSWQIENCNSYYRYFRICIIKWKDNDSDDPNAFDKQDFYIYLEISNLEIYGTIGARE